MPSPTGSFSQPTGSSSQPTAPSSNGGLFGPRTSFRRLTEAKYQDKRSRGLCFRCDKKFHRGHECEQKSLQVLLLADEEDSFQMDDSPPPSPDSGDMGSTEETLATLSLNSLVGISSTHTMKLVGHIEQKPVTVLIDSGAIHNFISTEIVATLGIPITATTCYGVLLGTSGKVRTTGICAKVELDLGALRVVTDFLPLELGGADVILG